MLPLCEDEVLLAELAVVAHAGWDLPSRPQRRDAVRRLLLLSDVGPGASYTEQAHRLLVMLDRALLPDPDDPELPLTDEDSLGLRILFGTHSRYRTERSPVVRRAEASEYLVLAWRYSTAADRSGSFLRRHQQDALRVALERLRHVYGQDRERSPAFDVVAIHRHYEIGANRQVVAMRCDETLRARLDCVEHYEWFEPRHEQPGLTGYAFELLGSYPAGIELNAIVEDPVRPTMRDISLRLPSPARAGDELRLSWHEKYTYDDARVDQWQRFFVGMQAPNGHFKLTLSASFDVMTPKTVWCNSASADVDPFKLGPDRSALKSHADGSGYSHTWSASVTASHQDYLLQWDWANP